MENNIKGDRFMRLYNIYYVCKYTISDLEKVKTSSVSTASGIYYSIENWDLLKNVIDRLCSVECLKNSAIQLFNTVPIPEQDKEIAKISSGSFSNFQNRLSALKTRVYTIIDLYECMNLGEAKVGLEIKIPQTESFSEYIDILKDLKFIFEQCPYCRIKDERLEFSGTDVGSTWLTFALISEGTYRLLNNIGKLVDKAIGIKSHFVTLKMQEEELEAMGAKQQIARETIEIFEQMKKLTYKKYVLELVEEIEPTSDAEEDSKVEKSLEKLANLIDKGVEIYTSIETPKEVKAVFPVSDKQNILPDSLMKYLEDKSDEKDVEE